MLQPAVRRAASAGRRERLPEVWVALDAEQAAQDAAAEVQPPEALAAVQDVQQGAARRQAARLDVPAQPPEERQEPVADRQGQPRAAGPSARPSGQPSDRPRGRALPGRQQTMRHSPVREKQAL
ncbi:hypothetical protein [Tardiphaga sp.]|uniref:hypothetical protein n=1 Tax=Tardiphaga sp. TaxID=1926292 RepID=UPI00344C2394